VRRRSTLRNAIEYLSALAVLQTLQWAPLPVAKKLGAACAFLLDRGIPRLRRIAMRNLQLAMPEKAEAEHRDITDEVFRSIGRLLVAFARFPRITRDNVGQWIRYEGYEHFKAALARGRGVLFATAHLGNWELSAYAHSLLSAPMHVLVRPLDNPFIDRVVERRRTATGNRIIAKKDFVRGIVKALSANEAVGILVDQNASLEAGVFVDFFGVPACASSGFARIAARTGAAVIPGFALWSEVENRYVLRFYPPVEISGDIRHDTARIQLQLEQVIRETPGQWLWIHRRWKTRPDGEPPLYG
jgi:KDO2-lipid IV(A) lauroyltransferase